MRLIDREDFNSLDPSGLAHNLTLNADGRQNPGPYLYCVNDQGAWVGRLITDRAPGYSAFHTAPIDTVVGRGKDKRWQRAATLWLKDESIDQITLVRRYKGIAKRLGKLLGMTESAWIRWDDVYYWPEASDLLWDGLAVHRTIDRRETDGVREVKIK